MLRLKSYSDGYNNENEPSELGSHTPYPSRSPSLGHSNWPLPLLDTILERSDSRSLRTIASAPKLRSSLQRSPKIVRPQETIRSIRPQQSRSTPWPLKDHLPPADLSSYKSFSAPNLDCLERVVTYPCSSGSSSSSRALRGIPVNPAGPARPVCSPPERRPTPEGLPSFGTKEAQELRLHPEFALFRGARALAHWMRGNDRTSNEVLSEGSPSVSSPVTSGSPPAADRSVPMDMLQRVLGASRVVEAQHSSTHLHPRVSLPRGVSVADTPGVLAVADDGTYIRGRFGGRMSAHGVGPRTLSQHPMARTTSERKNTVDRTRAETGSVHQSGRAEAIRTLQSVDRMFPAAPSVHGEQTLRTLSSLGSPRALGIATTQSPSAEHPLRSMSSIGSPRMREPRTYPLSTHGSNEQGLENSGIAGLRPYIEHRGRDIDRQLRQDSDEKSEDECWQSLCLSCCDHDAAQSHEENAQRRRVRGLERMGEDEIREDERLRRSARAKTPGRSRDGRADSGGGTGLVGGMTFIASHAAGGAGHSGGAAHGGHGGFGC